MSDPEMKRLHTPTPITPPVHVKALFYNFIHFVVLWSKHSHRMPHPDRSQVRKKTKKQPKKKKNENEGWDRPYSVRSNNRSFKGKNMWSSEYIFTDNKVSRPFHPFSLPLPLLLSSSLLLRASPGIRSFPHLHSLSTTLLIFLPLFEIATARPSSRAFRKRKVFLGR